MFHVEHTCISMYSNCKDTILEFYQADLFILFNASLEMFHVEHVLIVLVIIESSVYFYKY